jgi:diadenylate cyclase
VPDALSDVVSRIDLAAVVDIVIVSLAIYWLLLLIQGTTAMTVLRGAVVLLLGAFALSRVFDLRMLNWILRNSLTGLVIAVLVIFQPEIRRALERLGRTGLRSVLGRQEHRDAIDVVVRAATRLARANTGALILLERETGLQDVIDTGIPVNGLLSVELLATIFHPNSPLHDGAVVVRDDRVIAAGCTLPLSEAPLPADHGMRHRAGLGIAERSDCVVVIVSEERGAISLASNGRMAPALDEQRLSRQLHRLFELEYEEPSTEGAGPQPPPSVGSPR